MVTVLQMDAPVASTRSTFLVLEPTPATVAVIREPPAEPALGEISINFGVRLTFAAMISFPVGLPFSK
jgi:hypothetical protein